MFKKTLYVAVMLISMAGICQASPVKLEDRVRLNREKILNNKINFEVKICKNFAEIFYANKNIKMELTPEGILKIIQPLWQQDAFLQNNFELMMEAICVKIRERIKKTQIILQFEDYINAFSQISLARLFGYKLCHEFDKGSLKITDIKNKHDVSQLTGEFLIDKAFWKNFCTYARKNTSENDKIKKQNLLQSLYSEKTPFDIKIVNHS